VLRVKKLTLRLSYQLSLAVVLIWTCGLNQLRAAASPTRVTIAYPSPSPRVAPLWVSQDLDFFGKYGLRPQVVLVRNNQMPTAGLVGGDLDIGYTGGTTVLHAAAAGAELKMVANLVSRGRGFLMVRSDIKKAADLAGKRIGVQSIGGTIWMYVMLTLEQMGLDVARDKIRLLVIGDQTVTVRALETQVIDAAVFTSRTYIPGLQQKGFSVLTEVNPAMAATGIVSRKSYLEKNPALVENAAKALIEGEYFSLAPSNKAQTVKSIATHLRLNDPSSAEEGYGDLAKEFDLKPYPSIEGLKNMQRLMALQNPKLNDVNPASLMDSSLMRKLEDSGFLSQLQARYRE
jgi:NitT/TauT family transport system substrate-binding protein